MSLQEKNSSLYLQIYQDIKQRILNGEIPAGTRLPTVEALSAQYGVSKITTKKATDMLMHDGLLLKYPGKGTFVASNMVSQASQDEPVYVQQKQVGIIMDGIADSFGTKTLVALELALGQAGYSCVIKFTNNDEISETACINKLLKAGVSGLILKSSCFEEYNDRVVELSLQNFPLIFVDRKLPGLRVPYVGIDHYAACRKLCDRMIERGHSELALAYCEHSAKMTSVDQRIRGFADSCLSHRYHYNIDQLLVPGDALMNIPDDMYSQAMETAIEYFEKNPQITGVIALSESVGQMIILAARQLREKNGRQIEVAHFDTPSVHFPELRPVLYVQQDETALAAASAQLIIQKINGEEVEKFTFTPFEIREA